MRGKHVIGPDGHFLTVADLPSPETKHWVIRRKAQVVVAVRGGLLILEQACSRYALNFEEFRSWKRSIDRFGVKGLRTTQNSVLSSRTNPLRFVQNPSDKVLIRPTATRVQRGSFFRVTRASNIDGEAPPWRCPWPGMSQLLVILPLRCAGSGRAKRGSGAVDPFAALYQLPRENSQPQEGCIEDERL